MASKRDHELTDKVDINELLDQLETTLDRTKVMYEQYFLGIAKQAPTVLHTEVERRLRDLTQENIRNTAQRYRFAAAQQKFSSYNSYWRRTLREIEQGRYLPALARMKRHADRTGAEIPAEILAAMPKRMREQIARERAAVADMAKRRAGERPHNEAATAIPATDGAANSTKAPTEALKPKHGAFLVDDDDDVDFDAIFASIERKSEPAVEEPRPRRSSSGSFRPHPPVEEPLPDFPRARKGTRPGTQSGRARTATGEPEAPSRPAPAASPPGPQRTPPPAPRPPPRPSLPRPSTPSPQRNARPAVAPPPGMSDADVRTLYSKYAKARELVGEKSDASTYKQLLRTLHKQAPKIMEQYGAKSVEFGVTIKDNQVILKAKPK